MDATSLNFIDLTLANIAFLLFVGFVGGLVSGWDHHQGHAEQLRQRLQEVLRRLRAANCGPEPVHEESGPVSVARLRAGAGSGRKGLASGCR